MVIARVDKCLSVSCIRDIYTQLKFVETFAEISSSPYRGLPSNSFKLLPLGWVCPSPHLNPLTHCYPALSRGYQIRKNRGGF